MTRPISNLEGFSYTCVQNSARVRIWAISPFGAPINTYRVRAVPLVLDPQLLPR